MLLTAALPVHPETDPDGKTVRILFTNNSNGKLVNCNCRNDPLGGLAERVSLVTSYRAAHDHIVLVDSGGYLGLSDNAESGQMVFGLMNRMAYNAIGIGDQELYHGLGTFLARYPGERGEIVNASLLDTDSRPVFEPWRIVKAGDIRIGIIGLASSETFRFFPDERRDFAVTDPDTVLSEVLPMLEGRCDFILVLSQMGFEEDKKLARRWPAIGLIVGGHSQTLLKEPEWIGETAIVQAGKGGGRIGEVILIIDDNGLVRIGSHRLIELDETYKILPEVQAILDSAGLSSK